MSRVLLRRLDRLGERQLTGCTERTIHALAEEFGIDPAEVRREIDEVGERIRRCGPGTVEELIGRWAVEFDLPVENVQAEYRRITGAAQQSVTTP